MSRLLIVDDEKDWCEGPLRRPLECLDCEILTEGEREAAIALVQDELFDLVILNIRLDVNIRDANITSQWTELLDLVVSRGAEAIVVTSRSFSPAVQADRLMRMAFKDYRVTDFLVKEDFNVAEYRDIVQSFIEKRGQDKVTISGGDRQTLIDQLANDPSWTAGSVSVRRGILLGCGLPSGYVLRWDLAGAPLPVAGMVINLVARVGIVADFPKYHGLGLVTKYLFDGCPDVDGRRFLASLVVKYRLASDEEWLDVLGAYLD